MPARKSAGGGMGTEFEADGGLIPSVAGSLAATDGRNGADDNDAQQGRLVPVTAGTLGNNGKAAGTATKGGALRMDFESETFVLTETSSGIAHTLRGGGFDASEDGTGRGTPLVAFHARQDPDSNPDVTHPLDTDGTSIGIAFDTTQITPGENRCNPQAGDPCHPLAAAAHAPAYATAYEVRRLTPMECARLQGVPDDYLDITYRGKKAADGPKYKALGNGFAVPVVAWIAGRINKAMETAA